MKKKQEWKPRQRRSLHRIIYPVMSDGPGMPIGVIDPTRNLPLFESGAGELSPRSFRN